MQSGKASQRLVSISIGCLLMFGLGQESFGASDQKNALAEIQNQIIALRNEFKGQIEKVAKDQATIDEYLRTRLENLLNTQQALNTSYPAYKDQVNTLAATLNAYNDKITALEQGVANIETAMNQNLDSVATQLAGIKKHGLKRAAKAANTPAADEPPPLDVSCGQLFRAAYRFYMDNDYETAVAGFQKYLADCPNTPLTGAAQYWIAEAFGRLGAYDAAIQEYDTLIKKYPQNDKVADAYYGKGMALLKLGKPAEATPLFAYVLKLFPGTIAAKKAEAQLKQ